MMRPARLRHTLLLSLALTVGATACSGEEAALEAPAVEPEETTPTGSLDAEGNLRESEREYGGLVLPLGIDEGQDFGRSHVYEADDGTPIASLVDYFRAHLETEHVEERGLGAIWRVASTADGQVVDVSVLESSTGTRVEVTPRPPREPSRTLEETQAAAIAAGRDRD